MTVAPMRVVSPFRPFAPESVEHQRLGAFDWIDALRMLAVSVRRSCACETLAITDIDTDLPVPALQFQTTERRLMLWILEVSLRYLESEAFDRDTAMVCPDLLVQRDLRRYFRRSGDLGLLVRGAKFERMPILNSVQFWSVAAKDRLVAFFAEALRIAKGLPDALIQWGADTAPLVMLTQPIAVGVQERAGLLVRGWACHKVVHAINSDELALVRAGHRVEKRKQAVIDFRYMRKLAMRDYFNVMVEAA